MKKKRKSKKYQKQEHDYYCNWNINKSAKAMEPTIAIKFVRNFSKEIHW